MSSFLKTTLTGFACLAFCGGFSCPAHAWGPAGHAVIGSLAVEQLDSTAEASLVEILGSLDWETVGEACNWPDNIRDDQRWDWAYPLHYVNLPRKESKYNRERDCREGLCVTEGIKRYAAELQNPLFEGQRRRQAFSWLCHLVGDVHQPLHSGYRDDRGGNTVTVQYRGTKMSLHSFWDSGLIDARALEHDEMARILKPRSAGEAGCQWKPEEADQWTETAHWQAGALAYPDSKTISEVFEARSWEVTQAQLALAADRLACVLNALLGEGEVLP